jgi:hypothetical protein
MNAIKDTPEAVVAFGILGAIGLSPTQVEDIIVSIFGMKGTAVITNVPGPRQPLYFAGQKIETLMFWVPTPANLAMGVSIISYAGQVILGVTTDEGLIPDPENILRSFYDELDYLKRWGRPSSGPADRQQDSPAAVTGEVVKRHSVVAVSDQAQDVPAVQDAPEAAMCQALTRSGKPCKNRASPGQTTCHVHRDLITGDKLR